MIDISIVIAHREVNSFPCKEDGCSGKVMNTAASQPLGLWATIHSIEMDLQETDFTYDYRIQTSGDLRVHPDTHTTVEYIRKTGKLGYYNHSMTTLSPPSARHNATLGSNATYLFFFDNHILVKPGYFKRAIESINKYNMDMLHSTTGFFLGEPLVYEYRLTLAKNFWCEGKYENYNNEPYRIAAGGHGGFIVKTAAYREVDGYWTGFEGYGGEETYLDLKMNLLDKTNWIDPKLIHYHYSGNRGYQRHYTDDFYINAMCSANIIGGSDWLNKVYSSFSTKYSKLLTGNSMFDLMDKAQIKSKERKEWLDNKRVRTLDEQLQYFVDNKIQF